MSTTSNHINKRKKLQGLNTTNHKSIILNKNYEILQMFPFNSDPLQCSE